MEFDGEFTPTVFLGPSLSDTVPVNRLIAMALGDVKMNSESKEYLDITGANMAAENNPGGNHWDQAKLMATSESDQNPNGIGYPFGAGPNLNSTALEELFRGVEKGNTRCFIEFVESKLKRIGRTEAAAEFVKRVGAKTATELEEFSSVKLWNLLSMPYQMLMAMVHQRFMNSPPALYIPPVTSSFVIPPTGWKPNSSRTHPQIEFVGPIGAAPFFADPNAESVPDLYGRFH